MNDLLFIIVDSLSYERVMDKKNGNVTPFLDQISDDCIIATNMYSQGPYTEAGTKGLLCSCNTLDNGGYFLRYDTEEKFITDYFKEAGYETYNINAPSYLLSKKTIKNIDHMIYTSGLDCRFLWSQRFAFYYEKWKENLFLEKDYLYLQSFMDLVFESLESLYEDKNINEKFDLIRNIVNRKTLDLNRKIIKNEKDIYIENKNKYIDSIFELKLNHPIFCIQNFDLEKMIETETIKSVIKKKNNLVRKLKYKQFYLNLKNNRCYNGLLKRELSNIVKNGNEKIFGELINRIRNVISGREISVYKKGLYYTGDPYKLIPSAKTQFEYAFNILNTKTNKKRFILLHVEEPHYFNTFFSYDRNESELLLEEFSDAENYIDSLDSKYKGSLFYDLSVRYIDRQIEFLYRKMESNGLLKNTTIVVTADHGSSYFFNPIRNALVNNFHVENYHVPLYIFGKYAKKYKYEDVCLSKDVIPTIMELFGVRKNKYCKGESILYKKEQKNKTIIIEYMGPGCPDIRLKPVWLSARSKRYAINYIGLLKDNFSEKNIIEIFDLISDHNEQKNIMNYRNVYIDIMINELKKRFEQIRKEQGYVIE